MQDRDRDDPHHAIEERLREAIDTLRVDATRVELWATALSGFARPIPDYEFEKHRLKRTPKEPAKVADSGPPRGLFEPPPQPLKSD